MKNLLRKLLYNFLTLFTSNEKLIFLLSNKEERALLGFKTNGYLHDIGWVNSYITNTIVDASNNPIPWVTYPFIQFIESRLQPHFVLFEYGSGNSTLYYSKKVATVDSIENDKFWYDKIHSTMPANVSLFFCELIYGGDYCKYSRQTLKSYDIIIVDGRDRVNSCKQSIGALKPDGVIILDDSERIVYQEGINFLLDNGFKKLDFWGMAPNISYLKCTTIFYKPYNSLGI